jgi:hypothetical protein
LKHPRYRRNVDATLCIIPASHFADKHGREPFIRHIVFFTSSRLLWLSTSFAALLRNPCGLKEFGHFAKALDYRLLRARAA